MREKETTSKINALIQLLFIPANSVQKTEIVASMQRSVITRYKIRLYLTSIWELQGFFFLQIAFLLFTSIFISCMKWFNCYLQQSALNVGFRYVWEENDSKCPNASRYVMCFFLLRLDRQKSQPYLSNIYWVKSSIVGSIPFKVFLKLVIK